MEGVPIFLYKWIAEKQTAMHRMGRLWNFRKEEASGSNRAELLKLLKDKRPASRSGPSPSCGRNDYCSCGSGKKYKNCCWDQDHTKV